MRSKRGRKGKLITKLAIVMRAGTPSCKELLRILRKYV